MIARRAGPKQFDQFYEHWDPQKLVDFGVPLDRRVAEVEAAETRAREEWAGNPSRLRSLSG